MFLNDKCIQTFITEHSFLIIVCKDHPHMYMDWSKKESKFDTSTKTNFYKLSLAETKMRMHFIWEHTFIPINNIIQKLYLTCIVWAKYYKTHFLFDFEPFSANITLQNMSENHLMIFISKVFPWVYVCEWGSRCVTIFCVHNLNHMNIQTVLIT